MRALDAVLVASALVLALSAAYLARELHTERSRAAEAIAMHATVEARVQEFEARLEQQAESSPRVPAKSASSPKAATAPNAATLAEAARAVDPFDAKVLKLISTPEGRAIMVDSYRVFARREHPGIGEALRMTGPEEEAFLAFVAEESVRNFEDRRRRERGVSGDDYHAPYRKYLGPERFKLYEEYIKTVPFRRQVKRLRAELSDADALGDDQAARLVTELSDEQQKIHSDRVSRRGDRPIMMSGGYVNGTSYEVLQGEDPKRAVAQQSREFVERMCKRAGTVLTSSQLKTYESMLERSAAELQGMLASYE